jgi:hypothetical protein
MVFLISYLFFRQNRAKLIKRQQKRMDTQWNMCYIKTVLDNKDCDNTCFMYSLEHSILLLNWIESRDDYFLEKSLLSFACALKIFLFFLNSLLL